MPAHNAEATVRRAISSTLAALPPDSEIVLYDDASTDSTADVADSIPDPRIRVIRGEVNQGVAASLSRLMHETDSQYIARMDSDDVSLPWRFSSELNALANGAGAVFAPVITFGRRHVPRPQRLFRVPSATSPYALLIVNPFVHSTLVASRDRVNAVGAYRDVPSEDYDLWLRLATDGAGLLRLAYPTLLYRFHPNQVTKNVEWKSRADSNGRTSIAHATLTEKLLGRQIPGAFEATRVRGGEAATRFDEFAAVVASSANSALSSHDYRRLRSLCRAVARLPKQP